MRRILILAMATLLLSLASSMSEAQRSPDAEGQPTTLRQGALASYWIWHDSDGYHLRTTTGHDRRIFSGHIEFSGGGWARAYQLREDDQVKLTNQGIAFHLATERNLNGFDFRMDPGSQATISLQLDEDKGEKILGHVFMGQNNAHPITNPFTIYAASAAAAYTAPVSYTTPTTPTTAPPAAAPSTSIMAQEPASVDFISDPSGADIYIDGYFKGNTPSTLQVPTGQHNIELRMRGYRTHSVSVSIDAGSHARISRTLEQQ